MTIFRAVINALLNISPYKADRVTNEHVCQVYKQSPTAIR